MRIPYGNFSRRIDSTPQYVPFVSPVLYTYSFLTSPSMPAELSLSRATTGMYFDTSGVHSSAAIDAARFENVYNGTAWVPAGLLVEEQRTNYVQNSNVFILSSGSNWTGAGTISTTTGATQPDGNAGIALTTGGGTSHGWYQTGGPSSQGTLSLYAKEFGGTKQWLGLTAGVNSDANFDVATGATTQTTSGVATDSADIANGWHRLIAIGATGTNISIFLTFINGSATPAWDGTYGDNGGSAGTNTYGFSLYGEQAEVGLFATSYIPTAASSTATRSADLVSATGTLATQLAAGPSVWEMQDQATDTISRTQYAAGAFDFPTSKLYRSFGVYPSGTDTSPFLAVGGAY